MPTHDVTKTPVPEAITTPATVKAGIGTLEFTDGYTTGDTAAKLRDHLDYLHGVETFMNTIQAVSTYAVREGLLGAGINDGDVISPTQPDDVGTGNWIQTDPDKGWFVILRLYSPLQPFFDKTWRPGEFEPVA
jgi:hypothetical protein